jgi:hypothetical protein
MKTGHISNRLHNDSAVANMIEYLMVSAVIMALFIVILLLVNTNIMEDPANRLVYVAFTDIGNGVSTRMIDVYAISPKDGTVFTHFDIPDDIAGKDYFVDVGTRQNSNSNEYNDQYIRISRNYLTTDIALSGIGASPGYSVGGSTTGKGMNTICYNSSGVIEGVKC